MRKLSISFAYYSKLAIIHRNILRKSKIFGNLCFINFWTYSENFPEFWSEFSDESVEFSFDNLAQKLSSKSELLAQGSMSENKSFIKFSQFFPQKFRVDTWIMALTSLLKSSSIVGQSLLPQQAGKKFPNMFH